MSPHAPMTFIGQLTLIIYFYWFFERISCAHLFTNVGKFHICNVKPRGSCFCEQDPIRHPFGGINTLIKLWK